MSDYKQKRVCWDCSNYATTYMYGINGLCWPCLDKMENNEEDGNKVEMDKDKELEIGR